MVKYLDNENGVSFSPLFQSLTITLKFGSSPPQLAFVFLVAFEAIEWCLGCYFRSLFELFLPWFFSRKVGCENISKTKKRKKTSLFFHVHMDRYLCCIRFSRLFLSPCTPLITLLLNLAITALLNGRQKPNPKPKPKPNSQHPELELG